MINKKKNYKWFVFAGIMSIIAGTAYLIDGKYTNGLIFVAVGGLYIVMSKVTVTHKHFEPLEKKTFKKDEIYIDLMGKGKKNEVIKHVRKVTNCDLLNAEKFVDNQLKK